VLLPLLARGAKLLHCPHYDVPALYRRTLSATIHDVTHLIDPAFRNTVKARAFANPVLQMAAKKARRIITVSQYSKQMIVDYLGVEEDKISVIHNSTNPIFAPMPADRAKAVVRDRLGINRDYFLFVGSPKPHKNLPVLFEALAMLYTKHHDAPQLVIVGRDGKHELALRKLAAQLKIEPEIQWIEFVSDELLRACYAGAEATVLPSREEGFGYPVIESMACGTPVVCSNAASLPEIGGGCSLMFEASRPESCCERLLQVISSHDLRAQLRERGLWRARHFESTRVVREHALVFAELLAE
jgi:glycosyltransferase involved in cell wall biosynthesis